MIHKNVVFFCNKFVWVGDLALQNSDRYFRLVYKITLRTFFFEYLVISVPQKQKLFLGGILPWHQLSPLAKERNFTAVSFRTRSVAIALHYGEYCTTRANKRNVHGRYFLQMSSVWFLRLFSGYRGQTYFKMHFEDSKKTFVWTERRRTTARKDTTHWSKFYTSPEGPWEVSL